VRRIAAIPIVTASLLLAACSGSSSEEPAASETTSVAETPNEPSVAETPNEPSVAETPNEPSVAETSLVPSLEEIAAWGYQGLETLAPFECADTDAEECEAALVAPGILSAPFTAEDQEYLGFFTPDGFTVDPAECAPIVVSEKPTLGSPVERVIARVDRSPGVEDGLDRQVRVVTAVYEWSTAEDAYNQFQELLSVPDSCGSFTYGDPDYGDIPASTWLDGTPSRSDDAVTWVSVDRGLDDSLYMDGVAVGQVNNKTYHIRITDSLTITDDNYQAKGEELLAALQSAVDWTRVTYGTP